MQWRCCKKSILAGFLLYNGKILAGYLILVPGSTGVSGTRSDARSPAARIIPLLSIPKIFAGFKLTSTTTCFPTRVSAG